MTVSAMMMRRLSAIASVTETANIDAVAEKLARHDLGAVLVLGTSGRLIGIITDADLVKAFASRKAELPTLKAKDIMDSHVHTCRSDETELEVITVMTERQIRHMAVMMDNSVVGLVTLEEAVKHRLQKVQHLTEKAAQETNNEKRLAMVNSHMRESWSIFEVFRAVNAVQEVTGLAQLEARSRHLLWLIADGDNAGRPIHVKDVMVGHRFGSFPTVRKNLGELIEQGLVECAVPKNGRSKPFQLTQRGREVFDKMTKSVSDTIMSLLAKAD